MKMEIISFERVGHLTFGMKRGVVREIIGPNFTVFTKSQWSTNSTDNYSIFGLHLYYTEGDQLEFVEMFPPANPVFEGQNLFQKDMKDLLEFLTDFDTSPEIDGPSYIFHKIGIGIFVESNKLASISAFVSNYWD